MPFKTTVAADVSQFTKSVAGDMPRALEKVQDSLDDVTRDADKAGDKLESSLRDAQRAADKTEDSFGDLARSVQRDTTKMSRSVKDFGDDVEHESKGGFGKASAHIGEFKEEALQNFSEVTSSFDGSMQSVLDLAQGTFGGLASAGGPIGLAAGGISVLLGGLFAGMSAAADAEAQKTEERISAMFDDMADSGKNYVSEDLIDQNIRDIVKDTDQYKTAVKDAKDLGLDLSTVLRANAGDTQALAKVQDEIASKMNDAYDTLNKSTGAYDANAQSAGVLLNQLGPLAGKYGDLARDTDSAVNRVNAARAAIDGAGGAAKNTVPKLDAVGAAMNRIPNSKTVKVNAEAYTAAAEAKLAALARNPLSVLVTGRTRAGDRVF